MSTSLVNLKYQFLHIPTGTKGESVYMSNSTDHGQAVNELLRFLNRCNAKNSGTWQYWYN